MSTVELSPARLYYRYLLPETRKVRKYYLNIFIARTENVSSAQLKSNVISKEKGYRLLRLTSINSSESIQNSLHDQFGRPPFLPVSLA